MGKRLVIKGADFSANRIEPVPVPQTVEWEIGSIGSDGTIGSYHNAIHTNLLDLRLTISGLYVTIVDTSKFGNEGAVGVVALYDSNGTFISRIDGVIVDSTHINILVDKETYTTAVSARFVVGNYKNNLYTDTDLENAVGYFSYTSTGI